MNRHTPFLCLLLAAVAACSPPAEVQPSALFTDGVVLQRSVEIHVWGTARPGSRVEVALADSEGASRTDANGHWSVNLPAMDEGGPYEMVIEGSGYQERIHDVMIGDVWVASGQSNMEWTVSASRDSEAEIAQADDRLIRHFKVPHIWSESPVDTVVGGPWTYAVPGQVGDFSAVAYFFARELREHMEVPIGILNTSWGGSRIEPWMTPEALGYDQTQVEAVFEADRQVVELALASVRELFGPLPDDDERVVEARNSGSAKNQVPLVLYNAMVHPLLSFPIRGVIWYQGESNANAENGDAFVYRDLFPAMIEDWRARWGVGDFPFLWVQLANFMAPDAQPAESGWALLRESQSATLSIPNTGQAVIIDIGEADDIHPRNKQDVGLRLSLAARHIAFGEEIVYSGPTYGSHRVSGGRITIEFDHVGQGLVGSPGDGVSGPDIPIRGFAVAGMDRIFHWADARIEGSTVVVSSPRVPSPIAVRYAWGNNPDQANLFNASGLPASPFRTDTW